MTLKSPYSGALDPKDLTYKPVSNPSKTSVPFTIKVADDLFISQFAFAVSGPNNGYNPASDCGGLFVPYKIQLRNNCYNYACNNATNTRAQPELFHDYIVSYKTPAGYQGPDLVQGAQREGLILVVNSIGPMSDLKNNIPTGQSG